MRKAEEEVDAGIDDCKICPLAYFECRIEPPSGSGIGR